MQERLIGAKVSVYARISDHHRAQEDDQFGFYVIIISALIILYLPGWEGWTVRVHFGYLFEPHLGLTPQAQRSVHY